MIHTPLPAGTRFGPYEILAPIGAGGMGEVYRAKDTKLKREVALKVLPEALANDADRMARFQREAEVLAALNHPNIAQIYGVEDRALAMELVAGETLRGPLPIETALHYAKQIADALEAAHEKGIVHRDLKPANIMITPAGVVKVLDFGLAKAAEESTGRSDATNSPTLTMSPTRAGMILGTAAYMSPEQARGKTVDKRADVWAFGVVLYEMAMGTQLFHGETVSDILAAVLTKELDLTRVPFKVRRVLRNCIEKDPKQRLQAIGDWRLLLEDEPQRENLRHGSRLPWALAAVAILALLAVLFLYLRRTPVDQTETKVSILAPANTVISTESAPAISPDGRRLAFLARDSSGKTLLWVRSLDSLTARSLAGTEGAREAFWSPDNRFLGFFSQGKLKKVDASSGSLQTLCDVNTTNVFGGAWSSIGVIAFGTSVTPIEMVPASGGQPTPITVVDRSLQQRNHAFPSFLPDGRHFLYVAMSANREKTGLYVGSLDSKDAKRLLNIQSEVRYALPGYLLFARDGTLMAQSFDANRLELSGEPLPIAESVVSDPVFGDGMFSASGNGMLAYRDGSGGGDSQLTWFDRMGKKLGTAGLPGEYLNPELSPDGRRVAFERRSAHGDRDIWLMDLAGGTPTRFTFASSDESLPIWSPDQNRIVFASLRDGAYGFYEKSLGGAGVEERLLGSAADSIPFSGSLDGRFILFRSTNSRGFNESWALTLFPERPGQDRSSFPLLQSEGFNQSVPMISPNGHWFAYHSNETGIEEVYVQAFPKPGGKRQISRNGGRLPKWSRNGKELFYLADDQRLMAVTFNEDYAPDIGPPRPLFEVHTVGGTRIRSGFRQQYDVAPDGQRFLLNVPIEEESGSPITLVLNWTAGLKK